MIKPPRILPMSRQEALNLGIEQFDVILISGDAYVDHPSFGMALIGRVLWDRRLHSRHNRAAGLEKG